MWKIIIYLPAYNESNSLLELISRIKNISTELKKYDAEIQKIIIVDDASTDGSDQTLQSIKKKHPYVFPILKKTNEGPAAAIFDGMHDAVKSIKDPKRTILIRMDSDLEHQPEDIPALISPIIQDNYDAMIGYIKYDSRAGFALKFFNDVFGRADNKSFLDIDAPQFCPGFTAIRADLFMDIFPSLTKSREEFRKKYDEDMLSVDFIALVLVKRLNKRIGQYKLRSIECSRIIKPPVSKLWGYYLYHRKTCQFLSSLDFSSL